MKKFGTPSGEGVGIAKEKLGLAGVGTPGPVGPTVAGLTGAGVGCFAFLRLGCLVERLFEPVRRPRRLPGCEVRRPEGEEPVPRRVVLRERGGWLVVVVVEVVLVLEEVVEVVEDVVDVVTVTEGVVLVEDWQLAVTVLTGGVPAGSIWLGGVPGGALTVKVTVWPSSRVAVTVQTSAEALGIAATPIVTRTAPTLMIAIFSLWLIDTRVFSPPATALDRAEKAGAARQGR